MAATNTHSSYKETGFTVITLPIVQFLLAPRKTEHNAYAKFWGDKQRALWYVMVFSGVVN